MPYPHAVLLRWGLASHRPARALEALARGKASMSPIMLIKYCDGEMGDGREAEWFMWCGKNQKGRNEDGKAYVDVGDPACHLELWQFLSRAASKGCFWVPGPTARFCDHGSCCHRGPC